MMDKTKIENVIIGDLDMKQAPKFCDAYIESAEINGRKLTESELETLNDDGDFLYEQINKEIY